MIPRVLVVYGTRPEAVKVAPLVKLLQKSEIGLIQFKVGTGGRAVAYPGEWDLAINLPLYLAFDTFMRRNEIRQALRDNPLARVKGSINRTIVGARDFVAKGGAK